MGRLTTHVLDTAGGRPANDLTIEVYRLTGESGHPERLKTVVTNADGRVEAPVLEGEELLPGTYELRFNVAEYYRSAAQTGGSFYDVIPVRFRVADTSQHYHVPLLLSPFGYTTYRGS
jgi:5-hydroxyisourate hydrolase